MPVISLNFFEGQDQSRYNEYDKISTLQNIRGQKIATKLKLMPQN